MDIYCDGNWCGNRLFCAIISNINRFIQQRNHQYTNCDWLDCDDVSAFGKSELRLAAKSIYKRKNSFHFFGIKLDYWSCFNVHFGHYFFAGLPGIYGGFNINRLGALHSDGVGLERFGRRQQ